MEAPFYPQGERVPADTWQREGEPSREQDRCGGCALWRAPTLTAQFTHCQLDKTWRRKRTDVACRYWIEA